MVTPRIDSGIPNFGLAPSASGGAVQNSGCGEAPILDRASLVLTENPVFYPGASASPGANSINIQNCARISIWLQFTKGSLTNVILRTYFTLTQTATVLFHMPMPIFTAGSRVLDVAKASHLETEYTLTASGNVIIPIINPGAQWFRYSVEGTGTVTNSFLVAYHSRSFLPHHIGDGIPAS